MEIRGYLDFFRRRFWLLALGPLLAALAAYAVSRSLTPIYDATATIFVNQTQVPGVVQYNDVLASERLTNTYAELVERRALLDEAAKRLSITLDEESLRKKVNVSTVRDTQLLRIRVADADPMLASQFANALAQVFIDDNASQLGRPGTLSVAEQAAVPPRPARPRVALNVALAAFVGVVVAAGLALALEYLDDTVKTAEDVERTAALPTLGVVSRFRQRAPAAALLQVIAGSPSGEAYRQLRTNVHFAKLSGELKTLLVTSPSPREGKSTTAANLAVALAQAGERVIVVDTDLRRPAQHAIFEVPNSFGLTGLLLSGRAEAGPALMATKVGNLKVLPSGPLPPNPSELLTSALMQRLVASLRAGADYIVFDSPPVLAVTDASVLAAQTDATIVIAEAGRTRSEALRRAVQTARQANVRTLGVVLNKARPAGHGYYYGYYRRAGAAEEETPEPAVPRPPVPSTQPPSA